MATYIKKDFASPNGPILLLSAKGSTTASIAQADGVKDFSGNGNHGQAFGTGILVSEDNEMGACFDCQGTNGSYLLVQHGVLDNKREFTIHFKWKSSEPTSNNWVFVASGDGNAGSRQICVSASTSFVRYLIHDNVNDIDTGACFYDQNPFDGILHTFTYVVDFNNAIAILYVDGVKFTESVVNVASTYKITSQHFTFGNAWTAFKNAPHKGKLADIRVYPRALSAAEVKYLCNGFQSNIIVGQTIPSGAILDLSARGLTTAGIAQANGVVDRSGNGNHGQAYNGVAVANDDEMGSCFNFKGTTGCSIVLNSIGDTSNDNGYTVSLCLSNNQFTNSQWFICRRTPSDNSILDWQLIYYQSQLRWDVWDINQGYNPITYSTPNINEKHVYTLTADVSSKVVCIYMDGVKTSEITLQANPSINNTQVVIGTDWRGPSGTYNAYCKINDVKIYSRALTALEVQQLADASLKKITNIKAGSSDVRQIFSNGEMIYAKTNDYSLNL